MQYEQNFLGVAEARQLLDWAVCPSAVDWQGEYFSIYGRRVAAPRKLAWFGDPGVNYRYTGLDHLAQGWPPLLSLLRERLAASVGKQFNFVLLNRYDTGGDYMGWHRDDELAAAPEIASLSVGATRRFRYRCRPKSRSRAIDLAHGSLLVFDGCTQHMLTRTRRVTGTRINLTFRQVLPCK